MPVLLLLKKLLARLLFPIPLIGLLLTAGLLLHFFGKTGRRAGRWFLFAGIGLYLLLGIIGHWLLVPLTGAYPPLEWETLSASESCCIVVAGNAISNDENRPDACRFNDSMATRLREAARIGTGLTRRNIPFSIVAADCTRGITTESKLAALRAFFADYRIEPERIELLEQALTSRQEVRGFLNYPGKKILVSEAFHMPRLMVLSRKYALNALPAPAGGAEPPFSFTLLSLVPNAENLRDAERAVYEYLGIIESMLF